MIDLSKYDFSSIKDNLGSDPFEEKSKYEVDTRFYHLEKDKDGNGGAIIAFLPDQDGRPIQQLYRINSTNSINGKRRFASDWSPSSIGQPDPFQEMWQTLWNAGNKEEAKKFSRLTRYIANIKIIKDPANPANNGKIFLYDMSYSMKESIMKALQPSEQEIALGETPKEVLNPLRGWVYYIKCSKGSNGITDYSRSEFKFLGDGKCIYGDLNSADTIKKLEEDISKTYRLSDFLIPHGQPNSVYKSYEELKEKLNYVLFKDGGVQEVQEVKTNDSVSQVQEINSAQDTQEQIQEVNTANTATSSTTVNTTASTETVDNLDDILSGL